MTTSSTFVQASRALLLVCCLAGGAFGGAVAPQPGDSAAQQLMAAQFEAPAYRIISDEDRSLMEHVKHQIDQEFANFKDIDEVHKFLDKVKLLVQKHPKNVAFASGDLKNLHKFLSQEIVTRLIRVDMQPFEMPISDDKMVFAQRAIDEDELTSKLFSGPLRSLVEAKRQHMSRTEDGNHRDGNFFSNFWCKISGNCSN